MCKIAGIDEKEAFYNVPVARGNYYVQISLMRNGVKLINREYDNEIKSWLEEIIEKKQSQHQGF